MKGKLELSSLSGILKRSFAAQAVRKSEGTKDLVKGELKQKVLPNGLIVASMENLSPVSKIGVYVRAGSRFETSKELGASHFLRYATGMHTQNFTIFGITRNIEYSGASLTAASTREDMIYRLNGLRESIQDNFKYLADSVVQPAFKFWQLEDYKYRMEVEIERARLDPQQVLLEEVHRIAFKGGLQNSLYASHDALSHTNPEDLSEMLHHFHQRTYVNKRVAIVGLGIDQDHLLEQVEKCFAFSDGSGPEIIKNKFIGGESRIIMDASHNQTYALVATEGASAENLKDILVYSLLGNILSTGVHVKKGNGGNRLSQAAAKVAKAPFRLDTVNINYSDTGLFGFVVACHAKESGDIVKACVAKMRDTCKNVKEEDLQLAKHQAKAALLIATEDQSNLMDALASTLMNHKEAKSVEELEKHIDGVTLKDIQTVASKIIKSKGTLVSVGNLDNMCYLDDLAA